MAVMHGCSAECRQLQPTVVHGRLMKGNSYINWQIKSMIFRGRRRQAEYTEVDRALSAHVAERIKFSDSVLFRCLQCSVPRYFFLRTSSGLLTCVPSRRRLRSSSSNGLIVRPSRLFTVGDRAFPVAGANLWHDLPDELSSLQS